MAVMRPGSENTPSRSSLSIKRLDTKQGGLLERLNSIVQAEKSGTVQIVSFPIQAVEVLGSSLMVEDYKLAFQTLKDAKIVNFRIYDARYKREFANNHITDYSLLILQKTIYNWFVIKLHFILTFVIKRIKNMISNTKFHLS
jgi:hypothetical protein